MTSGEYRDLRRFLERKFGEMDAGLRAVTGRVEGGEGLDRTVRRFDRIGERLDRNGAAIREICVVAERSNVLLETIVERLASLSRKLDEGFGSLREEMAAGFREQRAMLRQSYDGLDRRVARLEGRVDRLEERGG